MGSVHVVMYGRSPVIVTMTTVLCYYKSIVVYLPSYREREDGVVNTKEREREREMRHNIKQN